MDCYIWAIKENGGWDWIKRCLRDRKSRESCGYGISRFPQKSDILVFYSKNKNIFYITKIPITLTMWGVNSVYAI